jgi:hypothetical protein
LSGDLEPEVRQGLRRQEEWETCFQAWLDSETPSAIREALNGPENSLLEMIDAKAIRLLVCHMEDRDEVELMQAIFPYPENWEDQEDELLPPELREKAARLLDRVQA